MASSRPDAPDSLPLRTAMSKGGDGADAASPNIGPKASKGMSLLICVLSANLHRDDMRR